MILDVESLADSRLTTGVELLSDGGGFRMNRVEFTLANNVLSCAAVSEWQPENLTDDRARDEINRAQYTHTRLAEQSTDYQTAIADAEIRYSVIYNYGMGSVELCHLDNGHLVRPVV